SRMLTVVTSLKAQHRNVLDFLSQTCAATRLSAPRPSLLPQTELPQTEYEQDDPHPAQQETLLA
ncbi:MAG: hypothetical protein HC768_23960, partial [Acaryochloris sp. CRU_2_0]|nr:hypothetical protein [Acaryochloris sp. CRU_2_0]